MAFTIIALAGCGSGYYDYCDDCAPPTPYAMILSDPAFDGDITRDPVTGTYLIAQGNTESVFVGIDPVTGAESRAFLDFPLRGRRLVFRLTPSLNQRPSIWESSTSFLSLSPARFRFVSTLFPSSRQRWQEHNLIALGNRRLDQTSTITPPISQADLTTHRVADVRLPR